MSSKYNFMGCAWEYKVHRAHGILGVDFTQSILLLYTPCVVPLSKKNVIITFKESNNFNITSIKKGLAFFIR
jgi:hypothetical protein